MDLAVNKVMKTVIENTIIPELEAENAELKVLVEKAKDSIQYIIKRNYYNICLNCMELDVDLMHCIHCDERMCDDCVVKTTGKNECSSCNYFICNKHDAVFTCQNNYCDNCCVKYCNCG